MAQMAVRKLSIACVLDCKEYVTDSVNFAHYSTLVLQRVPDESFHSQILSAKRVKFHLAIPLIWIRKGSPTFFSRFLVRQACNDRRYTDYLAAPRFAGLNGTRDMKGGTRSGRLENGIRHALLTGFGNLGQDSRRRRSNTETGYIQILHYFKALEREKECAP
ncbi:hypothetical protein B0H14DRAFT_2616650 [Mycena olivaceomarginata]|nr:hypothetical protein B0H14DRAFT_2616650 [Mycena olivaceomarginata]